MTDIIEVEGDSLADGNGGFVARRSSIALAFQNHLGDGLSCVCEVERAAFFTPSFAANSRGLAVKGDGRAAAGHADYLAVAPAHAMVPSCTEAFMAASLAAKRAA